MTARHIAIFLIVAAASASKSGAQVVSTNASTRVMLAGSGTEPQINTFMDGIADLLNAKGVEVKALEVSGKSRTAALEGLKAAQGNSLLYVTVVWVKQDRTSKVQCFDREGKQLWEEEGKGGVTLTAGGYEKKSLKDITAKLERHIGDACLPKR